MFSRSVSGSLFKEILKFDEEDTMVDQPDMSFPSVSCDEDIELLYESEGSVGSESDDPMRDETLLQDLFYVTKVCCSLSAFRLPFKSFLSNSLGCCVWVENIFNLESRAYICLKTEQTILVSSGQFCYSDVE
jgi:hypothetical protein